MALFEVLQAARACRVCAGRLPFEPRPLLAASERSRILIVGQAPGRSAHATGVPWDDKSGDRLRTWLGVEKQVFYDERRVALVPMGFCYPGKGLSGDLSPQPECAPLWHEAILEQMKAVRLRIYVGKHPLARYLPGRFANLTEAVRAYRALLPCEIVLPHPSPRNGIWLSKNPWFEAEALSELRKAVQRALNS